MSVETEQRIRDHIVAEVEQLLSLRLRPADQDVPFQDLNIDSLTALDLIVRIERGLGVRFTDEDVMNLRTLNDVVAATREKVEA